MAPAIVPPRAIPSVADLYKTSRLTPAARDDNQATPYPHLNTIASLYHGDMTKLAVDAIVNAANESLLGGGGIDGVIHRAAGPRLLDECRTLGGCKTGCVKATGAYDLPCKKIIHAVGPIYTRMRPELAKAYLRDCYIEALRLCAKEGLKSVAFCAISTGIYGFPSDKAAEVACEAVRTFLEQDVGRGAVDKVVFVTFEQKDVDAYNKWLPRFFPPAPEVASSPAKTGDGGDSAAQTEPAK